jgi:simple sugar transport system permease protein
MKRLFRHHEFYVFIVLVLLSLVITALNREFFTLENFFDMMKGYSFLGIFAVGVMIVLISGGIDISFTAVATVAEYVMAVYITAHGGNIFLSFIIAGVVGIVLGGINALLIYFLRIPTIITTIATLNIYYGLLSYFSGGRWIYNLPGWFRAFSNIKVIQLVNAGGIPYGLSIITVIWIIVLLMAWVILRYTTLGRSIYAVGGNFNSAQRAGLNIFRIQAFVYCFMGFLSGIAGVVQALLVQTVAPNAIVGKELAVIAAVVLGGANIAGGYGTLIGTIMGVTLVAFMSNGLTLMRVSSFWYNVCIGFIIMISVSVSAYQLRMRGRRAVIVDSEG